MIGFQSYHIFLKDIQAHFVTIQKKKKEKETTHFSILIKPEGSAVIFFLIKRMLLTSGAVRSAADRTEVRSAADRTDSVYLTQCFLSVLLPGDKFG